MKTVPRTVLVAACVPVAAVAIFAGIQSFTHIEALALRTHQPITDARLLPFSIDGLIIAGVVIALAGYWLGWLPVVLGVTATVFANVESGLPYGGLSATVAAWPAVAFAVASFVLERWIKRLLSQGDQGGTELAQSPLAEGFPEPSPEPPVDQPEPCGHTVAGTPEENVVQAYLHERDCLGQTPSQRRLAATHGVSRPKVAALVTPLNGTGGRHAAHT